ncbi:MAG: DUF3987 domain-containing protein [Symploca sp. SIO1C4]|uniref:DUF3987 domain-containing protein n=1 Tax=Symploca sp. SIO1C4 TaxID=2607765 RepID=A0A6B3NJH0_9CYAN|nr:DUF3987 domain-containing protein [Symploca sp. SIO1C4]
MSLQEVTSHEPCRHCGKPDGCYRLDKLEVCRRGASPAPGWKATSKKDNDGNVFYAPIESRQTKDVRPKNRRIWEYPSRDGKTFVRVVRLDDGYGKKKIWQERFDGKVWVKNLKGIDRADIPVYRYHEVQQAIKEGKKIFIVEGEGVADALWLLGLAATTNIGGAGKWRDSDSEDVYGATAHVLCPDRDKPGVEHMNSVYAKLKGTPTVKWLLAYPDSSLWQRLPESKGVDLADWISDFKLSADDLKAAIVDELPFEKLPLLTPQPHTHHAVTAPDDTLEQLKALVDNNVNGALLTERLNSVAETMPIREVRTLHQEVLDEKEQQAAMTEQTKTLSELLATQSPVLDLRHILPEKLAEPLQLWSKWMGMREAVVLTALLSAVSSLHDSDTTLVLSRGQNFYVPPTIYGGLVAESGQRKTPVIRTIITEPLKPLTDAEEDRFAAEKEEFEAQLEKWQKDKRGKPPEPPSPPWLHYFTDTTGEGIPAQAKTNPRKILYGVIDELSGLFSSQNAYRRGRGSDKQDLLSYFSGMGKKVLRADGVRCNLNKILLSIFGTIQPEVLKAHMKDCSDPDGQWARFLFVHQPPNIGDINDDEDIDIVQLLTGLYRVIHRFPGTKYRLSRAAKKRFKKIYRELEIMRLQCLAPGLRAVYAKAAGYIGRLSINLHCIWEYARGKRYPDAEIPLEIVELAIELMAFYIGQAKYFHASFDESEQTSCSLKLVGLSQRLELAGKNGGWVKASDFQQTFSGKKRPNANEARKIMQMTVQLGQGSIKGTGCHMQFHWQRQFDGHTPLPPQPTKMEKTRQKLGASSSPRSQLQQGMEEKLGFVGNNNCSQAALLEKIPEQKKDNTPVQNLENLSIPLATVIPALGFQPRKYLTFDVTTLPFVGLDTVIPSRVSAEDTVMTEELEEQKAITTASVEEQQGKEVNFDSFPHQDPAALPSAKQEKAEIIKQRILAIETQDDFQVLRTNPDFSGEELNWVRLNLLTKEQRQVLTQTVTQSCNNQTPSASSVSKEITKSSKAKIAAFSAWAAAISEAYERYAALVEPSEEVSEITYCEQQEVAEVDVPVQQEQPKSQKATNVQLVMLSAQVGYLKAVWDDHILAGIIGCESEESATRCKEELEKRKLVKVKIRKAERLCTPYEVLVHNVSIEHLRQIEDWLHTLKLKPTNQTQDSSEKKPTTSSSQTPETELTDVQFNAEEKEPPS